MGLYFRKSTKIGKFRINASSSGIGYSVGGKGFRIGRSSNGNNYISAGGNGVYYRKNIGSSSNVDNSDYSAIADVPVALYPLLIGLTIFIMGPFVGLICWSSRVWLIMSYIAAFFGIIQILVGIYYLYRFIRKKITQHKNH